MDAATIKARLQAPFAPDELEWRVGATSGDKSKGMALAYVTNRAIQNRLDDVFGPFGWRNEYQQWQGKSQLCGISVYDAEKGEWVTKWDGADNTEFESTKGGLSDAMKRAAYQWGIGRYLYKLDAKWVPIKPVGNKSYTLAGPPPALPAWALPEGYKSQPRQRQEPPKVDEIMDAAMEPLGVGEMEQPPRERTQPPRETEYHCAECGAVLSNKVRAYSLNKYRRALCMKCQKNAN